MKNQISYLQLTAISLGIALNMVIGTLAYWLKIPLYLDAIGTILITMLLGWKSGVVVGVLSFLFGGILVNPVLPYFIVTQSVIAIFVYFVLKHGLYRGLSKKIIFGILLGVVTSVVSAPVIVYLFGGITGSGNSLITAYLISAGKSILKAVALSGLASEPLDKLLQTLIAMWIVKAIPEKLLVNFNIELLKKNSIK